MTKTLQKRSPARLTYKPFYLIMLILSTISIAMSVWGVAEVPNLIKYFSLTPAYTSLMLFSFATLTVSISALILLYQKNKLGLLLMYVSLAINFLTSIVMLFITDQAFEYTRATSTEELTGIEGITPEQLFAFGWYAVIALGVTSVIVAATLWHFAWRNQYPPTKKS